MNNNYILCSECFKDQGLKLFAEKIGINQIQDCPNCNKSNGKKLDFEMTEFLAYRFFVVGSILKASYGASPLIQFNEHQKTNVKFSNSLKNDIYLFETKLGVGFFHYGPRLWMIGEIEPLKDLQNKRKRDKIYERIIQEFPTSYMDSSMIFYRVRTNPKTPNNNLEYDSPPKSGNGRLDSENLSILYGSQDIEVCIHECRVSIEDEVYLAALKPKRPLKLLNLTELLKEECTEFESLDLTVLMLFLAGKHSYEITKPLSFKIKDCGFDGIIYPSYFSLVRTGSVPFQTIYGISTRKFSEFQETEKSRVIQNIALFGRPIKDEIVEVTNINKISFNRIIYDYEFGPAEIG